MTQRTAIVLAAGKGTRMQSNLPKVLVPACGRPLIDYVLDALEQAGVDRTMVVVGYQANAVREALKNRPGLEFVLQEEQLGTGHAVQVCRPLLEAHRGPVVIVTGDSPLTQTESIDALFADFIAQPAACVMGTLRTANPQGLGRIVRSADGQFAAIVEEKDATPEQREIMEVNMSTYVFDTPALLQSLSELRNANRQGEYYLTDCPGILLARGLGVRALPILKPCEALSVNTVADLKAVEAALAAES